MADLEYGVIHAEPIPGMDRPPTLQCAVCLKKQDEEAALIRNDGWICPSCARKIGNLIGVRTDKRTEDNDK